MEFDELQRIWDSQNNKPLYAIDEAALHRRILSKKKQARHITSISELLLITVYFGAGSFILGINLTLPGNNIFMYVLAAWIFATSLYILSGRVRRIKGDRRFDRSMHGDLGHAISMARYQVRLSQIMRWNILPIGGLLLLSAWEGGKSSWVFGVILISFGLAYYAGAWEHGIYKARKRELQTLQSRLGNG